MKRCSKCGKIKPEAEFHKDRKTKSGLRSWCKECISEREKLYVGRAPSDFAKLSKTMDVKHLADHYNVSDTTIYKWRRVSGIATKRGPKSSGPTQAEIDYCLNCELARCIGNCTRWKGAT